MVVMLALCRHAGLVDTSSYNKWSKISVHTLLIVPKTTSQ